jgi:collagenase-like PrtC family protease
VIEILAPAGDNETLKAAVYAGADAVYAGGERFGARAYAKNFGREELLSAIDFVHLHGRKLYLTVNTLVKEREFADLYEYLLPFYRQGVDAVIVQDAGVMSFVRSQFPGLAIHASTQMTITNVISAKYLEGFGVKRVVPARELSLSEVRKICENTGLEVECFVHGALCYCYSGQCLLSSMIGGRSGNRGQCAQPCRLPYQVGKHKPGDILSLKDLCTIEAVPDLIESGIVSFKIEGRMKQPEYVAAVTGMYRKYTDMYLKEGRKGYRVSKEDIRILESAYQRRGYCGGYYFRHNGKEMISLERPKQEIHRDWKQNTKVQEKITGKFVLSPGKRVTLYLQYQETKVEISGAEAEPAIQQPIARERLLEQLKKTGNTPFVFDKLEIIIEGSVFLPIQEINSLRRRAIEALEKKILEEFRRKTPERISELEKEMETAAPAMHSAGSLKLTASVETLEQMEAVLAYPEIVRIYVEDALWESGDRQKLRRMVSEGKSAGRQVFFAMARIFRQEARVFYDRHFGELTECFSGALARNIESVFYVKERLGQYPVITDNSVYQWNRYAKNFWKEQSVAGVSAPVELNRWELMELGVQDMELTVYGYLPVMVSAGCVKKTTASCDGKSGFLTMTDRQGKKMTVKNECVYCYNTIYNSSPLMLADRFQEIKSLEPESVRLQFSAEDKKRTADVLELYAAAYRSGRTCPAPEGEFTRGHFKRGVK